MLTLEPIRSFPVEEYLLTRLAFSPDGSHLAVGHKKFHTFDAESGEKRAEFDFPEFVAQLRYSQDGKYVAAANVGDNHPGTRGRLEIFDAASGRSHWSATADTPIETCALTDGSVYWNAGAAIAGSQIEPRIAAPTVPLVDLQVRSLAKTTSGFACFGREAVGATQQVEGADLIFRKFRLRTLDGAGAVRHDVDLGIGAGVHALSPDGKLLAAEMVDFKNNERHVSLIDAETGVEANLLPLEANTLPVFEFGLGSEYFLCMKEDGEEPFNTVRIWRTSDLKLMGELRVEIGFHSLAARLEHSLVAFLGGGKLDVMALS